MVTVSEFDSVYDILADESNSLAQQLIAAGDNQELIDQVWESFPDWEMGEVNTEGKYFVLETVHDGTLFTFKQQLYASQAQSE